MRIDLHPAATAELEDSADWYAQRSHAAVRGFAVAVDDALAKIERDPHRFVKIDSRHQSCNRERYPFQVVYRDDGDRIYIIAIAHTSRRPGYWRDRD